jgi:hypothetical protein
MLFWWPRVRELSMHVPMPETFVVAVDGIMTWWMRIVDEEPGAQSDPPGLTPARAAVEELGGAPVFLRSDEGSGKHEWGATCYVADEAALPRHMFALAEWHFAVGLWASAWVIREYLPKRVDFRAHGPLGGGPEDGMPVCRERRYFVCDGEVECHHPYWPPESMRRPTAGDWRERLAQLNEETDEEIEELTDYARKLGTVLPGWWSIDFMEAEAGWYFIDAAEGARSWHPEDCPNAQRAS